MWSRVCLSVCLSESQPVCLSTYLFVCLAVSFRLITLWDHSSHLSMCVNMTMHTTIFSIALDPPVSLSVHLPVYIPVCLFVCLSVCPSFSAHLRTVLSPVQSLFNGLHRTVTMPVTWPPLRLWLTVCGRHFIANYYICNRLLLVIYAIWRDLTGYMCKESINHIRGDVDRILKTFRGMNADNFCERKITGTEITNDSFGKGVPSNY